MLAREPRVQPPALDALSDVALFNTKAVVHQTGVPAPTLRAWERRYSILTPRRGENDYRLYSERDIATVTWLRERVESGMTISQAIALLRSLEPPRRRGRRAASAPAPAPPSAPTTGRLALGELATSLLRAFSDLDELAARRLITQAMAVYPVEDVCLLLFVPVLEEIGREWSEGKLSVAVEHFASALIRAQLEALFQVFAAEQSGPLVFVGCAPGELHELGSLMLALALRRGGLRVTYLGQNLEPESLVLTVQAAKPSAVILSATLPENAEKLLPLAEALRQAIKPAPYVYVGGQGFVASVQNGVELAGLAAGHYLPLNALEAGKEIRRRLAR
ncbi:MAG TPA: B12-binding domain-containing protein [Ktedonobacterales bacterium]